MDADLFAAEGAPARRLPGTAWVARHFRVPRWLDTLKARIALGGLMALLAGIVATTWTMNHLAQRDLLRQAALREQLDTDRLANSLAARLGDMQRALERVGDLMEPSMLKDEQGLSRFLESQPVLRGMFSNVFVADAQGRIPSFVDEAGARQVPAGLAKREYFQRALREQVSVVSEPLLGRVSQEPVVVFLQPLVSEGRSWGAIGASIKLASRDLLKTLGMAEGNEPGVLVVITDHHGRILVHPERQRLMQSLGEEPRLAAAYSQWVAYGRPLQREAGQWASDVEIVATAGEDIAGWQVWRTTPRADLLAPLNQAHRQSMLLAVVLTGVMMAALFLYLAWQLRPLLRLEQHASALLAGDRAGDWPQARGEIGRLSRTLHHVWAERAQVEEFNAQVLRKLGSVMSAAPVGLAFTRHQRFELVSAELCHMLGRAEQDLVGQMTQQIFVSNEDYGQLGPQVAQAFEQGQAYRGEWQLLRADGSRFWCALRARPVDDADAMLGTIWSLTDINSQVLSRRQLEHAAHHDALTGVVNRQGFEQALQAVFDGQPGSRPAALVMIDLDHFKPINDSAGHAAGDAMLVAVAQAIASRVRTTDVVVRLGGDEFALLLPHCNHERALSVAEKVREAISGLALTWEAHTLRVGASLGVAELGEQHANAAQWLAQADQACYEAKRSGRGVVRLARGQLRVLAGAVG